jgi:diguanylate cyclase (GGDEF)-like protein
MVHRVDSRLETLARQTAIAQEILSSVDTSQVVRSVLERLAELAPCEFVAMLVRRRGERSADLELRISGRGGATSAQIDAGALRELRRIFRSAPEILVLDSNDPRLEHLSHPDQPATRAVAAMPLFFKRDLLGVVCIGLAEARAATDLAEARRLADHAAIALSNARMVDEIRFLAYYDELTGLPNRVLCSERLSHAIGRARRSRNRVGVLRIDLDAFKRVNDSLGQDVGDDLMRSVAARLETSIRSTRGTEGPAERPASAALFRVGGDEFACIVEEIAEPRSAAAAARQILEGLSHPLPRGEGEIFVGASIGVSIYPDDGGDVETLLRNAYAAMCHAKEEGRGDFRFYRGSMNEHARRRLSLETRLRKALGGDGLELNYQPIVDVDARCVVGAEALVRWTDSELGPVSPVEFIPIAEESGLIIGLGEWIIRTALAQVARWDRAGLPPIGISVNVSSRQFRDPRFIDRVRGLVADSGLGAERITLELTESVLMRRTRETVEIMQQLREAGLRLSIDDFGTGYSSLSYLKDLPIDALKIDRSFVDRVGSSERDEAIVSAVLALGRILRLKVVAEGVERLDQLTFLQSQGCKLLQGYLFSAPETGERIAHLLRDPGSLAVG